MSEVNLHIYPTYFKNDSRILKQTKSLSTTLWVDKIWIAAILDNGLETIETLDEMRFVIRVKFPFRRHSSSFLKLVGFILWEIQIFWRFLREDIKLVNCHSLSVLPLGILLKLLKGCRLVYDTHELETETIGTKGVRKKIAQLFEKYAIKYADIIFVVNSSIAEWYKSTYSLENVVFVRNIPSSKVSIENSDKRLKSKFNLTNNDMLFIYQGGMQRGRGIEMLLNVFSRLDRSKHILFLGNGIYKEMIRGYQEKYQNIHYLDAVSPDVLLEYTQCADVGLSIIENVCLSYYLCLPNKLFEYICAGIPVIASDFPEMKVVIDQSICGWTVPVNEESLFILINSLSIEEISRKKEGALNARHQFDWLHEEKRMLDSYRGLFRNNGCKEDVMSDAGKNTNSPRHR